MAASGAVSVTSTAIGVLEGASSAGINGSGDCCVAEEPRDGGCGGVPSAASCVYAGLPPVSFDSTGTGCIDITQLL